MTKAFHALLIDPVFLSARVGRGETLSTASIRPLSGHRPSASAAQTGSGREGRECWEEAGVWIEEKDDNTRRGNPQLKIETDPPPPPWVHGEGAVEV